MKSRLFGLREWIWRAFVRGALIPLVLVESVLIAVYLIANTSIHKAQTNYLREVAHSELDMASHRESYLIDSQLKEIGQLAELYRHLTTQALLYPKVKLITPPKLAITPTGVRYTPVDTGGAASFYSNITPIKLQDLDKIARLSTLDTLMEGIQKRHPFITSIYFNSWDGYNHIYPWFYTPDQYPHNIWVPEFNFYYLADAQHNPKRQQVWTDVYLDPAGQGWMMSAIAPVYRDDFLEGVVGLDITVGTLLKQINHLSVPWNGYAVLVSDQLNIMALPELGERDFGLRELTQHSYEDAVRKELLKPEDFNLAKRHTTQALAQAIRQQPKGIINLHLGQQSKLVAWNTVPSTNWHLLMVVDERNVYAETETLSQHYKHIGYLMIGGLVLFYILFFAFMWWRARHLSSALLTPIQGIQDMMAEIGRGHWNPERPESQIQELQNMVQHTINMEEQLQHSEQQRNRTQQRLELVLDSATESLWECDLHSGWTFLRGRFRQRFGLPADSISEAAFLRHIHPDDLEAFKQSKRLTQQQDVPCETEFRFKDANDQYHWLLGRGRIVEYDRGTGTPLLMAGTYVDIDALKQTEANLRQATLEAQAASQAKSRFISSISHELRTPLNAIYGFAQLIQLEQEQRTFDTACQNSEYLRELLVASQHLNALVNDILDWTSIQAEHPKIDMQAVSVAAILNECAELVRLEVVRHELQLRLELPDPRIKILADPRRLRQILLNLLSNAIKYNHPQGVIRLGYQIQDAQIRLSVTDTGKGIAPELQPHLFEPFQRLGQENTAIQGTGIGLSLCRELAKLLKAHIGFTSTLEQGSCFWVEFPIMAPQGTEPSS